MGEGWWDKFASLFSCVSVGRGARVGKGGKKREGPACSCHTTSVPGDGHVHYISSWEPERGGECSKGYYLSSFQFSDAVGFTSLRLWTSFPGPLTD